MLTKLELYLLGALFIASAAAAAWFYAKHEGVMEERARWEVKEGDAAKTDLKNLTAAVVAGNKIAADTLNAVQRSGAARIIDRGVIQREIQTSTIYRNDCFPASGLLQWNRISAGLPLSAEPTGSQPPPAVPEGVGAAGSRLQGRHLAPQLPGR